MKKTILKLNSSWFPFASADYKEVIKNICSGSVYPLDIEYGINDDGEYDPSVVNSALPVKSWDEWVSLPIRDYDEYLNTPNHPVRLPTVVICSTYNKIKFQKVLFPTNKNVWERDNYTCSYTLRKLSRDELSVDHIIPKSRGGEDSWMNLVTCCKDLNSRKGNKLNEEIGLKLQRKPFVPKSGGLIFNSVRPEWVFITQQK